MMVTILPAWFLALLMIILSESITGAEASDTARLAMKVARLPFRCDVIQLRSVESGGYVGLHRSHGNGHTFSARHESSSDCSRLEVHYVSTNNHSMILSVRRSGERGREALGFDANGEAVSQSWTWTAGGSPVAVAGRSTFLKFGSWPLKRVSTGLLSGPYYRLYVVDGREGHHVLGIVGADRAGRLSRLRTDGAEEVDNNFVDTATLFYVNVVDSPGADGCATAA